VRTPAVVLRRPGLSVSRLRAALAPSPRLKRRLVVAVLLAALTAALYMLWLRDSSLVAVEQVQVTGLTSRDAERVRAALAGTAETMTTLHIDRGRLEEAVAAFPVVAAIEVTPDFPNGLTIHVVEHRPAALLDVDGHRVPVAGDGSVLAGLPVEGKLPTIDFSGPTPQGALPPGAARDAARVAGGAPAVITRRLESIGREGGARGVVAQIEDGPEIVFGRAEQVGAKWAAAVRVLADDEASGAAYVDVRIPERPVAGGLPVETVAPVAPIAEEPLDPALGVPDPSAVAPVAPTADDPAVAPTAPSDSIAPAPTTTVAPVAPEAGGGAAPYAQP
jgi:cell division protein FtsQ